MLATALKHLGWVGGSRVGWEVGEGAAAQLQEAAAAEAALAAAPEHLRWVWRDGGVAACGGQGGLVDGAAAVHGRNDAGGEGAARRGRRPLNIMGHQKKSIKHPLSRIYIRIHMYRPLRRLMGLAFRAYIAAADVGPGSAAAEAAAALSGAYRVLIDPLLLAAPAPVSSPWILCCASLAGLLLLFFDIL
jgi:hypothetical protein